MKNFKIKIKAVVKKGDKYLVVKKWYDDRIQSPYQWEFLDGDLNFGESPETAAARIVREKTQLEVAKGTLLYTWSYVVGETCYVGICICFEKFSGEVLISEDLLDHAFIEKSEMNDEAHPMNAKVIEDIFGQGEGTSTEALKEE